MAYSVKEIFDMSIALADEISENGTIDANKTKEYANRAPYIADMWQKEMADSGSLYNTEEYVSTDEDNFYKWIKNTLPTTFRSIRDFIFIDSDLQFRSIQYRQFGITDIYLYFTALGTARMLYIPIPTKITALSDALQIDEVSATCGAYYLTWHWALADQNDTLAAMCKNKFNELKRQLANPLPIQPTEIIDVYGGGS